MNKKQLVVIFITLLLLTSMIWFPGKWFGYFLEGYPAIRPESVEFLVRIFLPLVSFSFFFIYLLRDRKASFSDAVPVGVVMSKQRMFITLLVVLISGLLLGIVLSHFLPAPSSVNRRRGTGAQEEPFRPERSEFKEFCKREGYREQIESLIRWIKDHHAWKIAIIYNGDDPYCEALYNRFVQSISGEKMEIVFSEVFEAKEWSFYRRLKTLESLAPEVLIVIGAAEGREAFQKLISRHEDLAYWVEREDRIKWIE